MREKKIDRACRIGLIMECLPPNPGAPDNSALVWSLLNARDQKLRLNIPNWPEQNSSEPHLSIAYSPEEPNKPICRLTLSREHLNIPYEETNENFPGTEYTIDRDYHLDFPIETLIELAKGANSQRCTQIICAGTRFYLENRTYSKTPELNEGKGPIITPLRIYISLELTPDSSGLKLTFDTKEDKMEHQIRYAEIKSPQAKKASR